MTRRRLTVVVTLALVGSTLAYAATSAAGLRHTTAAKLVKINMGTEPWIGYGPWWIAQKRGFFKKNGLDVNIVNFQTDGDRDSALIAGRTDVSNEPTNGIIRFDSTGKATVKWSITRNGTAKSGVLTIPAALAVPNSQLIFSEVSYAYTPTIGYTITGTLNLSDQMYMSPRITAPTYGTTTCT